jgi:hypothetical protein
MRTLSEHKIVGVFAFSYLNDFQWFYRKEVIVIK